MLKKIKNFHLFILVVTVFFLNLLLIKEIVLAQWLGPTNPPGFDDSPNILTNPLSSLLESLDFGGNSLTNLGEGGISTSANGIYFNESIKIPSNKGLYLGEGKVLSLDGENILFSKSVKIADDKSYYISGNKVLSWAMEENRLEIPASLDILGEISVGGNLIFGIDGTPLYPIPEDSLWSEVESDNYISPVDQKAVNIQSDQGYFQNGRRILKVIDNNTFLGAYAGYNNGTGDNNVYLGFNAGIDNAGDNNVYLGAYAGELKTRGDNELIIANSNTEQPLIYGDFSTANLINYGMFQVEYTLDEELKNLIYANALIDSTGGNLLKLQNNNVEKLRVDLDGNIYVQGIPIFYCQGSCPEIDDGGGPGGDEHG